MSIDILLSSIHKLILNVPQFKLNFMICIQIVKGRNLTKFIKSRTTFKSAMLFQNCLPYARTTSHLIISILSRRVVLCNAGLSWTRYGRIGDWDQSSGMEQLSMDRTI